MKGECTSRDKAASRQDKIDEKVLSCAAHLSFLSREAHLSSRAAALSSEGHLSPAGHLSLTTNN
jgi:hypothetical protein